MDMTALSRIDHFVVLMLENRSFDNLFGWLYPKSEHFDGLTGHERIPDGQNGLVQVWHASGDAQDMRLPTPDPGELFPDMNQQLFGSAPVTGVPPMNGFAVNYVSHGGKPRDIMHSFTPDQMPALVALARSYAVCDRWHAAAPCQTWPNRFFLHTGTANGYENNSPTHFPYLMDTIFNRLADKAPNGWKIYFHDFPQSLTLTKLWDFVDRFKPIDEFLSDCSQGTLPSYAFIEPRFFANTDWPNDMHPPHNVIYGDRLVAKIYEALRASACWPSTLLVILFDEHGGCFDHVPPPSAVPPEPPRDGQVFAFDRFGVRVPAVVVSPWIRAGTVFRSTGLQPFDHTAISKTLRRRFAIDEPLSAREAGAPDLEAVLNLDAISDEGRLNVVPLSPPPEDDAAALARARLAPPNDLQQVLLEAAGYLAPLTQPGSIINHVEAIVRGWRPAQTLVQSVEQAAAEVERVMAALKQTRS
jgi:phospholipase C